MEVTIYIETTIHGPAKRSSAGAWLIEGTYSDGRKAIRSGTIYRNETTENRLCLELLRIAFGRFHKSTSLRVNTRCEHILNSCQNHHPAQWEKNGWTKAGGKPLKNRELWKHVYGLMKQHRVTVVRGENPHLPEMEEAMRKETEGIIKEENYV